ncbi:hypothetical protein Tco_1467413 [Tanacetum coccineum]
MQVTVTGSRLLPVSASFIHKGRFRISIIFLLGCMHKPEGFLSSVLLWLVIIVAVVGVGVTVVVVVVESSSVVKLSFVITRLYSPGVVLFT